MIISVPHTGSRFVIEFIEHAGQELGISSGSARELDHVGQLNAQPFVPARPIRRKSPLVTPVRDPAVTMISHWDRKNQFRPEVDRLPSRYFAKLADGFRDLVSLMGHTYYVPIDCGMSVQQRSELLAGLLDWLGWGTASTVITKFANDWPPVGQTPPDKRSQLLPTYYTGNMREVFRLAPPLEEPLIGLRELSPWFRQLGYSRMHWQ